MEIDFSSKLKPFEVMVELLTRRRNALARNFDFHFIVSGSARINLSVPFMLLTKLLAMASSLVNSCRLYIKSDPYIQTLILFVSRVSGFQDSYILFISSFNEFASKEMHF